MKKQIFDSLVKLKKQYKKLKVKLSESFEDIQEYQKILKEINKLKPTVKMFENYLSTEKNIEDSLKIIKNEKDKEILSFAKEELSASEKEKKKIEEKLQILLLPKDENDEKNVVVEIRGAAGGDEANIFAGDLFEIYKKWSSLNDCSIQIINYSKGESGGFSQIVFKVIGQNVFSKLKYESGVHRVQRVPKTEVRGRVHTSTVTVTVMPEADKEVEIKINPSDLKIDTFRSTGPGGQSVNTTDSAVRITHLPTKISATSQQGKSQIANKEIAMQTLKTRLYNLELEKQKKEIGKYRKLAGSGSRSEKIRTYNYPQDRVTDHRLNLSVSLKSVLSGKLNEIFEGLRVQEQNALLNYSKDKGSE